MVDETNEEIAKRVSLVQVRADKEIGNWEQNSQQIWEENRLLATANQELSAALAQAQAEIKKLNREIEQLSFTKAQTRQGKKKDRKRGGRSRNQFEGS